MVDQKGSTHGATEERCKKNIFVQESEKNEKVEIRRFILKKAADFPKMHKRGGGI